MAATPAGYSGTPLARKLGIVEGLRVATRNAPGDYLEWLAPLPPAVDFVDVSAAGVALFHLFHIERAALEADLVALRPRVARGDPVWVSWPKRSARVATDISEDVIRSVALPLGYVDIKVCAVSEVWSGLKLVVRKAARDASR
ncbi:MAG: DUF3052 domain-containing protein [Arenimonas sp.]